MPASPSAISWRCEQFDELDSTNRLAAERILAAWDAGRSPERTLITAARQTAGRGQHGRRWESPPGGLYFSAVVERVPAEFRDRLALVAGLAVARTLRAADVPAMIRWPNDVLIDGKKIAGILCEALARGEHWAAIIGVGVNVSTDIGALPPDLRPSATNLLAHLPRAPDGHPGLCDPHALLRSILAELSNVLTILREQGLAPLIRDLQPLDALAGRRLRFSAGNETFNATAHGVDPNGHLLLSRTAEPPQPYAGGTVVQLLSHPSPPHANAVR